MKKILLFASALAGLFFAASCQQENLEPVQMGNAVTITVEAPGAMNTKAIADGENVNEVHYAVYKTNAGVDYSIHNHGTAVTDGPLAQGVVPMEKKSASIDFDLLQDQDYTVIFWAQVADAGHYNLGDLRTIEVATSVAGNDETRAAFYARYDFSTYEHKDHKVTLRRPFAQLNLLTTAESLTPVQTGQTTGYTIDVKASEVVVTGLSTTFNTLTGLAPAGDETFVFEMAATPEEPVQNGGLGQETLVVNGKAYHYVSMNYFFVPEDEKLVDIKYTVSTDKGDIKNEIVSVPVKENYRTNVIGNLLTKESTFEIVVDADFDGQELVQVWDGREVSMPVVNEAGEYEISFASELAWLAAAVNGTLPVTEMEQIESDAPQGFKGKTFKLVEDIDLEGALWTPIGNHSYDRMFAGTFDGNGHVISNLVVNNADNAGLFGELCGATIKNVTIEDFNLTADHYAGAIVGWVEVGATPTCVQNCVVRKGEITLNVKDNDLGDKAGAIVGYAYGGTYTDNTVSDVTIKGYRDLGGIAGLLDAKGVVRNNKVEDLTIIADLTVAYDGEKDCNAGEFVGRYNATNITVEDNATGENIVIIRKVDTTKELGYAVAEAKSGDTIYVNGEVTMPYFTDKALNFVGIAKTAVVKQSSAAHNDAFYAGAELNFSNLTLVGTSYQNNTQGYQKAVKETYTNCHFVDYIMFAGEETTVNDCTFASTVGQYFWTGTADDITFNNCKFDVLERAIKVCTVGNNGARTATFNNCEFKATEVKKAAIEIDGSKGSSYVVNINNCTVTGFAAGEFTGETLFNVEGAENVTVIVDGSEWKGNGLFEDELGNKTVTNSDGLKTAASTTDAQVTVKAGEYTFPSGVAAGVTINCEDGTVFTGNSKLNINGATVIGAKFSNPSGTVVDQTINGTFKNCTFEGANALRYAYAGETVVFENCVFSGSTYAAHFDGGANDILFKNCTFSGFNAFAAAIELVTFEGCKFQPNGKSNYNGVNLWGSAKFINTVFTFDGTVGYEWIDAIGADKSYEFTGCTINGGTILSSCYFEPRNEDTDITIDGTLYEDFSKNAYLACAKDMFWFAEQVNAKGNTFSGKTVKLTANVDLANAVWTPVGQTGATQFKGTFDGQGKTISNLNIDATVQTGAHYSSGIFGWLNAATVKNVNVAGAKVKGNHNVGVIAGYLETSGCTVEACHVSDATVECHVANADANGDKCGVIVGNAPNAGTSIKACTATDSTVSAGRDAGQIVGAAKEAYVTDCSATNVTVTANGEGTGNNIRNEVIGRLL